ncbi:hypothetical protein FACS189451_10720 [Bacteroidia bacterium]|nr:hypothetical protein FACS189451_10720 [Bacteroidia bacterium]
MMKTNDYKKMNDTLRLWVAPVILGFSLILSGLGVVFILDAKMLATVISGFIFLSGLLGAVYALVNKDRFDGWGFYLTLAIVDFVLGSLLLVTPEMKVTTISMMISLWILFQGLGKILYSLDLQKMGIRNWDLDLLTGILSAIYGVTSIVLLSLSPVFVLLTTALVMAFIGFFQISLSLGRQAEYGNYTYTTKVEPVKIPVEVTRNK